MILTTLDRLIVDDYPLSIEEALSFLCANKTDIFNAESGVYKSEIGFIFHIYEFHNEICWESQKNMIIIHFIISGEEFIEVADTANLTLSATDQHRLFYRGTKQARIRLMKHNILILYPEYAFRSLPSYEGKDFKKCVLFIPVS